MTNFKLQDEANGTYKIFDLKQAIGREFSDNYSSTNRSILVNISECGNVCQTMEIMSEYSKNEPKLGIKQQPSWLVWNAIFS